MFKKLIAAGLAALCGTAVTQAQDYYTGTVNHYPTYGTSDPWMSGFDNLNEAMRRTEQQIINANMNNPQVNAMYQQHVAQGGTMSYQEFAYYYAATGGFSQQGMQQFRNNELNNQRQEQSAWNGYMNSVNDYRNAYNNYTNSWQNIQSQRGDLLTGNWNYYDPSNGQNYYLPYTTPAGGYYYDSGSGNTFQMDGSGNYQHYNNGWWYQTYAR